MIHIFSSRIHFCLSNIRCLGRKLSENELEKIISEAANSGALKDCLNIHNDNDFNEKTSNSNDINEEDQDDDVNQFADSHQSSLLNDSSFHSREKLYSRKNENSYHHPIVIQSGFSIIRQLSHRDSHISSALYIPNLKNEIIASMDTQYVHIWHGKHQIQKFNIKNSKHSAYSPVSGINRWIFIHKWSLLIFSNSHLELKVCCIYVELPWINIIIV